MARCSRETVEGFDRAKHGERQRDDAVVGADAEAAGLRLEVDGHAVGILVEREDVRPEADLVLELAEEGVGQASIPPTISCMST